MLKRLAMWSSYSLCGDEWEGLNVVTNHSRREDAWPHKLLGAHTEFNPSEGLQRPGANAWIGAPPPPRLVNPASAPGEKIDKQKKKEKKGLQHEKVERPREIGALESSGPIAYATFATRLIQHTANEVTYLPRPNLLLKFAPTSLLGRRPLQGVRPGAMPPPPCPPPPSLRHCVYPRRT